MGKGIAVGLAATVVALGLVAALPRLGARGESGAAEAAATNAPAATAKATDFTLPDATGKQVKLSSLRGNVVVLSFWATWCPPCRMELPHLQALHTKYAGKKVKVVGVNLDVKGDALKKFLADNKLTFTVLQGADSKVGDDYKVEGIPTLLVIDKEGGIRERSEGFDPNMDKNLGRLIDSLLK